MKEYKLSECFYDIKNGLNIKQDKSFSGYPITRIETISNNKFNRDRMGYANIFNIEKYKDYILKDGDILMSHINSVKYLGRAVIYHSQNDEIIIHGMNLLRLKALRNIIEPDYANYIFLSNKFKRKILKITKKSVNQASFSINDLKKISILVPDLTKQKQIVSILDTVSGIIEKRKKQLEDLDELVKARFVEMFGDVNINDKNWEVLPLGELCSIVRGSSPRPIEKYLGGCIPWIKIGDATIGDSVYLYSTKEHIIKEGVAKSRMVKAGSLIFANCGVSLGFARIIMFDGCIHDGWLAMEDIDERLDKVFLLQALNQTTEYFRKIAPAGTQPNLNTKIMKSYKQIIPPMNLQKEFIYFVKQTEEIKEKVQKSLDETQVLFDSLMQKYF